MKMTLIFTASISGHNMEYLHHMYDVAVRHSDRQYVFVVPEAFEHIKQNQSWPLAGHIAFDYISSEESNTYKGKGGFSSSYHICKIVRNRIKKHKADKLFVMTLMSHLPFAPFMYGRRIKMSGIIYKIYLYEWQKSSWMRKLADIVKYQLFVRFKLFEKIYILNDAAAVRHFNYIYHTRKFTYLVDPYIPLPESDEYDLRAELSLKELDKLFIHFGALDARKGTLLLLDSLFLLDEEQRKSYCFVFAGRVMPAIREEFYRKIELLRGQVRVVVKDEFCPYEYLAALCRACDAILIPYLETAQSSGVIGYAAQFGKPVIAPKDGLIGKLVRRYHLGLTTDCVAYTMPAVYKLTVKQPKISTEYCRAHSVLSFQKIVSNYV